MDHSVGFMLTLKRSVVSGWMSGWRAVKSGVPQKSVLGLMLFNIFFRNMNHLTEYILNKFDGDTKLCGRIDMLEGKDAIQRDFGRLEMWASAVSWSLTSPSARFCTLVRKIPPKYLVSREWFESNHGEKD